MKRHLDPHALNTYCPHAEFPELADAFACPLCGYYVASCPRCGTQINPDCSKHECPKSHEG